MFKLSVWLFAFCLSPRYVKPRSRDLSYVISRDITSTTCGSEVPLSGRSSFSPGVVLRFYFSSLLLLLLVILACIISYFSMQRSRYSRRNPDPETPIFFYFYIFLFIIILNIFITCSLSFTMTRSEKFLKFLYL